VTRAQLPRHAATVGIIVFAGLATIFAAGQLGDLSGAVLLLLVNVVVFPELLDLAIRYYSRSVSLGGARIGPDAMPSVALRNSNLTPYQRRLHLRPYALVASIHNLGRDLYPFMEASTSYQERLWLIDDGSTDGTGDYLRAAGYRCIAGSRNQRKPAAIKELLARLPPEIETVVVFDPDTTFQNRSLNELSDLEGVIFDFQQSRMAALCPRIRVRGDTLLCTLQEFEYSLALLMGRKSLADFSISSGVAIYRRSSLERASQQHSLSIYAEDLEYSLLLLGSGEGIYLDDRLVVETAGKPTWRSLFRQRVGWAFGYLKVYIEQFGNIRRVARRRPMAAYQYLVYLGVVGLLLHPFRLAGLVIIGLSYLNGLDNLLGTRLIPDTAITTPWIFISSYSQCVMLATLSLVTAIPRAERRRLLRAIPLYLFYAAFLVLPTTVGFLNWFAARWLGRRLIRDPYQDEASLRAELRPAIPELRHA
jgi:cellulose synthase/poly-beta-1,6-N-acetylglucosamine synthase-like glycosyltransferase